MQIPIPPLGGGGDIEGIHVLKEFLHFTGYKKH